MTNSYESFRRLHQLAEEVGGRGTRVKDPLLFTKFLANSAKEMDDEEAGLFDETLGRGLGMAGRGLRGVGRALLPEGDPVQPWTPERMAEAQAYARSLEEPIGTGVQRWATTKQGPFESFIPPSAIEHIPSPLRGTVQQATSPFGIMSAGFSPARTALGIVGSEVAGQTAQAVGAPPAVVTGAQIAGGFAGAPEVPLALAKGTGRVATGAARGVKGALKENTVRLVAEDGTAYEVPISAIGSDAVPPKITAYKSADFGGTGEWVVTDGRNEANIVRDSPSGNWYHAEDSYAAMRSGKAPVSIGTTKAAAIANIQKRWASNAPPVAAPAPAVPPAPVGRIGSDAVPPRESLKADVLADIAKGGNKYAYHMSDNIEGVVGEGLKAGGFVPGRPIAEQGYGDIVHVFRAEDMVGLEGGDVRYTKGPRHSPKPIASFTVDELKLKLQHGARASEEGIEIEPPYDLTPEENAIQQAYHSKRQQQIVAAYERRSPAPVGRIGSDVTPPASQVAPATHVSDVKGQVSGQHSFGADVEPPVAAPVRAAQPPVQPPTIPPSDVLPPASAGGAVPPESAVTKLIRAIKTEKPMRGPTERMRSIERARRAGAGAEELARLSDPETAFQAALGKQRGALPTAAANGLKGTDFTRDDVAQLLNQIRGHGRLRFYEKLSTRTALYKAINYAAGETDQLPGPREFELLEEVFGRDLASALQSRKGRIGRIALEVMGIPKTLRSSFDISAPMRQGVFLSARHPKEWLGAWAPMFKSLKSDKAALESYDRILADPDYQQIVGSVIPSRQRISIVNPTGDALTMGARSANEEVFISRLANKIPGIRASNRAYTTYLNELRYNVAKTTLNNWKKAGVEITPEKMDMLGSFINISTGRGRLGKLEQIAPALNATFWSPRLLSSRFETPTLALQALKAGDKEIARLAAEELVAFVGMGTTALTLISLSGIGRVELDPRSSDFGKIRIGGTSLDFWGGFQQMARYTAQFMTSERKPLTKDDVLVDPAKAGMEPVQRSEVAFNFLRSKLAPGVPSLLGNEMTNRTFTGDKLSETVTDKRTGKKTTVQTKRPALGLNDAPEINTRLDEAIQQMLPLFGLELTRAIENDGWQGLATTAPGVTGIGVQSIPTTDSRQSSPTSNIKGFIRIQ